MNNIAIYIVLAIVLVTILGVGLFLFLRKNKEKLILGNPGCDTMWQASCTEMNCPTGPFVGIGGKHYPGCHKCNDYEGEGCVPNNPVCIKSACIN